MKYDYRKHKLAAHIILGGIYILIFHFILYALLNDSLMFIGVSICVAFAAGVTEKIQQLLNLGNNTAQGALRTCILLAPYIIYNIIINAF